MVMNLYSLITMYRFCGNMVYFGKIGPSFIDVLMHSHNYCEDKQLNTGLYMKAIKEIMEPVYLEDSSFYLIGCGEYKKYYNRSKNFDKDFINAVEKCNGRFSITVSPETVLKIYNELPYSYITDHTIMKDILLKLFRKYL